MEQFSARLPRPTQFRRGVPAVRGVFAGHSAGRGSVLSPGLVARVAVCRHTDSRFSSRRLESLLCRGGESSPV